MSSLVRTSLSFVLLANEIGFSQPPQVRIMSPLDAAEVPWRACFSGTSSDPDARLVAIVHPTEVSAFHVQPPISVRPDGRWKVQLYIGEGKLGLHSGKHFEVRVFSRPKVVLREGQKLPYWPEAESASPMIEVTRRDDAPAGCGDSAPSVAVEMPAKVPEVRAPDAPPAPSRGTPSWWGDSLHLLRSLAPIVGLALVTLFLVLILLPHRAQAAHRRVSAWLEAFRVWLAHLTRLAVASLPRLWSSLRKQCSDWNKIIWAAKGYEGNLRLFALRVLAVPLLQLAVIFAFYAEAQTIVRGLNPTFGVESTHQAGQPSLLSSLMNAAPPHVEEKDGPRTDTPNMIWRVGRALTDKFAALWNEEQLGFLAIALASLQGAFGIVLFWQMGVERPLRLRLLPLLQERRLLTVCFLVLNLALAVLAANRGFELSPDRMHWMMPSLVSAAIALVMPWIMTYSQHYALESAVDCLGVAKAIAFITCLIVALSLIVGSWAVILGFGLTIVGAVFVAFFLFCVAASAFLLFADLLGEAVRLFPIPSFFKLRPLTPVPVTLLFTAVIGGGYLLLRGLTQ